MRDHFTFGEYEAWWAFFIALDELERARKAQSEHDDIMRQAALAASQ